VRISSGKINNKGRKRFFIGFGAGRMSHHYCGLSLGWGVGGFGVQFILYLWGDLVLLFNLKPYLLEVVCSGLSLRI